MTEPAQAALQGGTFPKRTSSLAIYEELKAKVKPQNSLRQPSSNVQDNSPCPSLVPIFLALQGTSLLPPGPDVRENFLWRLGGPWSPAAAAKRICAELGLNPSSETLVTDQIKNGLRRYEDWPAGDPCAARKRRVLLELRLDVTLGRLRYTDHLLWDPYTTFASAAEEFAVTTCADLGLPGLDWPRAIAESITDQVDIKWAAVLAELRDRESSAVSIELPTSAEWVQSAQGNTHLTTSGPQLQWVGGAHQPTALPLPLFGHDISNALSVASEIAKGEAGSNHMDTS